MGTGKSARPAKRSASSSFSTVSTVIFVAFCVFGVYMLTSSSLLGGGSAPAARVTKFFASEPPPAVEDEPEKPRIEEVVEENRAQKEEEEEQRALPEAETAEKEVKSDEKSGRENGEKQEDAQEQQSETKEEEAQSDDSDQHQPEEEKSDKSEEDQPQSGEEKVTTETFSDTNHSDTNGEDGSESEKKVDKDDGSDGENKVDKDEGSDGEKKVEKDDGSDGEKKVEKDDGSDGENKVEKDDGSDGEKKVEKDDGSDGENKVDKDDGSDGGKKVEKDDGSDGENKVEQDDGSDGEKKVKKDEGSDGRASSGSGSNVHKWLLCNTIAGFDYIPCLDNEAAIKKLHRRHYEHRERHCPEEPPSCLVPIPEGYKQPIEWPKSRDKIWYHNVPHTKLAVVKGHQNWVKVTGEYLTFPGGGTQFIHGALHYIDFLRQAVPKLAWGKHTRVILDVGCGVASFGGYLFERDVIAMSFAPKDEHEAQVQFALERGIPAISAVMGTQRLLFPSKVFDAVHCARCRVPWHVEGGMLLLELNRVLRPGGYFLWSATPVYQKLQEDVGIWKAMKSLTAAMCWELITIKKDKLNGIGAAIFRKPTTNECYEKRKQSEPPMCKEDDDPNAAWYVPLQACMHKVPVDASEQGSEWPVEWPRRLRVPPNWLNTSQTGIYGKPAPADFSADYDHWKQIVSKSYLSGLGIDWSNVRNVMDMKAIYGGFAAALNDLKLWVMNVVNVDFPDTLPIIYDRGLFGIYHDWCESFSTYPRTYDLLHADHLFSGLKKRCNLAPVMAEVDRILRPGGKLIVRDEPETIGEVESLLKSLHWEIRMTFNKDKLGMLSAQKMDWRPKEFASQ